MFATTTRSIDTKPIVQALSAVLLATALVVAGSVIAQSGAQTNGIPAAGAAISVPTVTGEDASDLNWAGFRQAPASVGDNDLDWNGFRMTAPSAGDKDLDWAGFVRAPSFPAGTTSADRGYGRNTGLVSGPSFPAGTSSADHGYGRNTGLDSAPSFSAGAGNTQEQGLGHR